MKNAEVWAIYDKYTSELTKHTRQIAFGGVAVCWLFRAPSGYMSDRLILALGGLTAFFVLDVLQFLTAAVRVRLWARREEIRQHEITGTIDGEYKLPPELDRVPFWLWCAKIVALLIGFFFLGAEVVGEL